MNYFIKKIIILCALLLKISINYPNDIIFIPNESVIQTQIESTVNFSKISSIKRDKLKKRSSFFQGFCKR